MFLPFCQFSFRNHHRINVVPVDKINALLTCGKSPSVVYHQGRSLSTNRSESTVSSISTH